MRITPGRYRTVDGLYEVKRFEQKVFRGGKRWIVERGWVVEVAPDAPADTPLTDALRHGIFATKAEAILRAWGQGRNLQGRGDQR